MSRRAIPAHIRREVLAEAGYYCGNPTCRVMVSTLDIHHIVEVAEGGTNDPENLIALCPNCHRNYHSGPITQEDIQNWKIILVELNSAFRKEDINKLLFLASDGVPKNIFLVTGDGLVQFASLIAHGLVKTGSSQRGGGGSTMTGPAMSSHELKITARGEALLRAWRVGDRATVSEALAQPIPHKDDYS
jgi:hypothetical protein